MKPSATRAGICLFSITFCAIALGDAWRSDPSVDAKVQALVDRMTIEQKLGQLTQQWGGLVQDVNPEARQRGQDELDALVREGKVGSYLGAHGAEYINRLQKIATEEFELGIPLMVGNDVIHGYRTIFPINLAQACSFDLEGIERAERVAATEARAAGTHWTFAPMVDIARDPRWGRVAEGAGEDPWLGARIAAARVRGFQGKNLSDPDAVVACAKHYVAYGAAEGGRDYNTVDISIPTLRNVYLPPFGAAVGAGVGTLMSAFNEINGVPATACPLTLKTVLRDEWAFEGFVVSDWGSIQEMVAHGYARDDADAARLAIQAGVDMDMSSFTYRTHLADAVKNGLVDESVIDRSVKRILRMKYALGLFDNPFSDPDTEKSVTLCHEHRDAARALARKSIVLLKNDDKLLPLSSDVATVAVIGPLAESKEDPLGTWATIGKADDVISVLDGVRERAGNSIKVLFAPGCDVRGDSTDGFAQAVQTAKQADVVVMVLGEDKEMSGEGHSRATLGLPGVQLDLLKKIHATGKPIVVVLMHGRPLAIPWTAENVPAVLAAWHLGVEMGHAVTDILFGDANPSGRLAMTFPRGVGQVPIYYAHKNTGRPPRQKERYTSKYIDMPWTPQFPFGYGLTYTQFKYDNLRLSSNTIGPAGLLKATADVSNTGDVAGVEVVQMYVRDLVASQTRPVKQLRGFKRVTIEPGKTVTVEFELFAKDLGFYNSDQKYIVEPGAFKLWIGPNAQEGLETDFSIVKNSAADTD